MKKFISTFLSLLACAQLYGADVDVIIVADSEVKLLTVKFAHSESLIINAQFDADYLDGISALKDIYQKRLNDENLEDYDYYRLASLAMTKNKKSIDTFLDEINNEKLEETLFLCQKRIQELDTQTINNILSNAKDRLAFNTSLFEVYRDMDTPCVETFDYLTQKLDEKNLKLFYLYELLIGENELVQKKNMFKSLIRKLENYINI